MESEKASEILVNGIQKNLEEVGNRSWELAWAVYYGKDLKGSLKLLGPVDEALTQINEINHEKAMELKTIVGEGLVSALAEVIEKETRKFLKDAKNI